MQLISGWRKQFLTTHLRCPIILQGFRFSGTHNLLVIIFVGFVDPKVLEKGEFSIPVKTYQNKGFQTKSLYRYGTKPVYIMQPDWSGIIG